MSTVHELNQRIDKLYTMIEKSQKPASAVAGANVVFGERGPYSPAPSWNNIDPVLYDRLQRVGKAYDDGGTQMSFGPQVKRKCVGWGEHLVALADSMGHSTRYGGAMKDLEKLEKQTKFVPHHKAMRTIKGVNGEVIKSTSLAENSGQAGGYLIPPQFMTELLTIAGEDAFIEPRCKILPMTTRTVQWPMLDITTAQSSGTTPYAGGILGTWQPEAATISETEPAFKQSEWTAWDLVLYAVSSNQLLADNGIGLDALLTQLFAWAITWYKEYAFLQGKGAGSSMPLGILNAPATITQTKASAGHVTFKDLAAMIGRLQIRSWDSACWIAHQSVLVDLVTMNDISTTAAAGQHLTWLPHVGEGGVGPAGMKLPKMLLNGLPLFFTEKLPPLGTTGCLVLADLSQYVIGQRLDFQIDVSPHYLFKNNQLAWRVIARCDGKPWLNNVITQADGSATYAVSPFVMWGA